MTGEIETAFVAFGITCGIETGFVTVGMTGGIETAFVAFGITCGIETAFVAFGITCGIETGFVFARMTGVTLVVTGGMLVIMGGTLVAAEADTVFPLPDGVGTTGAAAEAALVLPLMARSNARRRMTSRFVVSTAGVFVAGGRGGVCAHRPKPIRRKRVKRIVFTVIVWLWLEVGSPSWRQRLWLAGPRAFSGNWQRA